MGKLKQQNLSDEVEYMDEKELLDWAKGASRTEREIRSAIWDLFMQYPDGCEDRVAELEIMVKCKEIEDLVLGCTDDL
jgi:hypothetical protein